MGYVLRIAFLAGVFAAAQPSVVAQEENPLVRLEASLNAALDDDEPITLREGTDFTTPPGTVIFVSREEGAKRMVALARTDEPELAMLFLPRWQAWVTHTIRREPGENEIDTRYALAALASEPYPELWHTHNGVGEPGDREKGDRNPRLRWAMPSDTDLTQVYRFARNMPYAKFRCVVASMYGVATYWSDKPDWAVPVYVSFVIVSESKKLRHKAGGSSVPELKALAEGHEGFIEIRFEPVP